LLVKEVEIFLLRIEQHFDWIDKMFFFPADGRDPAIFVWIGGDRKKVLFFVE
jgi:hypothetical protein